MQKMIQNLFNIILGPTKIGFRNKITICKINNSKLIKITRNFYQGPCLRKLRSQKCVYESYFRTQDSIPSGLNLQDGFLKLVGMSYKWRLSIFGRKTRPYQCHFILSYLRLGCQHKLLLYMYICIFLFLFSFNQNFEVSFVLDPSVNPPFVHNIKLDQGKATLGQSKNRSMEQLLERESENMSAIRVRTNF